MTQADLINILNRHYPIQLASIEFVRDSGSLAYTVLAGSHRYFLRAVKPAFSDTALHSADIHVFLQKQGFSVPPILFTNENAPYVRVSRDQGEYLLILYEFIEGGEVDPEQDAEAIGELLGKLHRTMRSYPGLLVKRDKHFFIGRYIDLLRTKQYPKTDEFSAYGDAIWDKVKDLPRGYCHGDMYRGNILKSPDGKLYVLDFDTSCEGFPMYDPVLICNMTDYFAFMECGYEKSKRVLDRFLPEYLKHNMISQAEINAFFDLIAVYHFQLQATIIELFGLDCVDHLFFDAQLDWLYRWRDRCRDEETKLTRTGHVSFGNTLT